MSAAANFNTLIKLLEAFRIEVPRVQRDYAQGRENEHSTLVRKKLLKDLKEAFSGNVPPLDLGFVYGKTAGDKFYPVDGQQRLTTLFLLHTYAFYNDESKTDLLLNFSYEARTTTRDFFQALVNHRAEVFAEPGKPSVFIKDQAWFVDSWQYDPSVLSALNMLDDMIAQQFNLALLQMQLEERVSPQVVFQFLNLDDLGMEDDLYIKLNARGRALTPFENFKAKFIDECEKRCPALCNEIKQSLDGKWADLFWNCSKQDFDKLYLTFFAFVFANHGLLQVEPNKDVTTYWIYSLDYQAISPEIYRTIRNTLNYLSANDQSKVHQMFVAALLSTSLYPNKIIFHAICKYLSDEDSSQPDDRCLENWLRVIKNLVDNSRIDESKLYLNAIKSVNALADHKRNIIEFFATGDTSSVFAFERDQIREEAQKARIINKSNAHRDTILAAEQKLEYFGGQIRCALHFSDYEEKDDAVLFDMYVDKIAALFSRTEPREGILLRRALCCLGDYTLLVNGRYKTLCTDDAEENSRTPSLKSLFSNHGEIIRQLLAFVDPRKDIADQLNQIIQGNTVAQNDWRYCFIHYPTLFEYMKPAHFRLCEADHEILMIPNKSSTGKNYSLYLTLLQIILKEKALEFEYVTDEGTNAERFLQNEKIRIYFSDNCYKVFDGDSNIWESSANDFVDETANKIISLCS